MSALQLSIFTERLQPLSYINVAWCFSSSPSISNKQAQFEEYFAKRSKIGASKQRKARAKGVQLYLPWLRLLAY